MEFQSEIRTLAQVEHLNLVKFYGFFEHQDERIVVVEYVPNGTLREHLDCEYYSLSVVFPFVSEFVYLQCKITMITIFRFAWKHS